MIMPGLYWACSLDTVCACERPVYCPPSLPSHTYSQVNLRLQQSACPLSSCRHEPAAATKALASFRARQARQ